MDLCTEKTKEMHMHVAPGSCANEHVLSWCSLCESFTEQRFQYCDQDPDGSAAEAEDRSNVGKYTPSHHSTLKGVSE